MNGNSIIEWEEAHGRPHPYYPSYEESEPQDENQPSANKSYQTIGSFRQWLDDILCLTPAEKRERENPGQNERDVQRIKRQRWEFKKAFKK